MFDELEGGGAASVVTRLSALVDELQNLDLPCLPGDDVLDLLRDLEVQKRRLVTVDHALIGEVDTRGMAGERACRDTASLLGQVLRISRGRPPTGSTRRPISVPAAP